MLKYLKLFDTHAEYEAFTQTEDFLLPNVSYCKNVTDEVHYNPYIETKLVLKFNVTSTSSPTTIINGWRTINFSAISIDGVLQPSVVNSYTFDTLGEHTVKYALSYPTTIGENSFTNITNIISVKIPSSVTTIGESAFKGCSGITNLVIPDTVTTIRDWAFDSCSGLTNVKIGSGITAIGVGMFLGCTSLANITIPSNITSIGGRAFENCSSLVSITSLNTTAPSTVAHTFVDIMTNGTLYVPSGSTGYDVWMQETNNYLGQYGWTKIEI